MAKEFNVGDRAFIPAKITKVICGGHYKAEFFVGNDEAKTESFDAKVGTLFTAKQVSDKYIDGPTYDDLKTERDTLKMMLAERDRLLASANADITTLKSENERLSEQNEELGAERDKFAKTAKDKADLASKACDERNDVQGDLVTAREAIDYLQEENNKLKQEVENRMTDYKLMRDNNAVYLSRIAIRNEVIDALVEKIRRLEGGD